MFLLIGDTHFTEHARDEYRFGLFNWIRGQQNKRDVAATFLAGDITDSKDRHSATLVNKIVAGLVSLKPPIYILRGNHDYSKNQDNAFFNFLNHIDGLRFITEPTVVKHNKTMAMIPHYRSQNEFDEAIKLCLQHTPAPNGFLVHQTFDGAIAESGVRLSGLRASLIESAHPPLGIYAGDVHRPQSQGDVKYIGCPYQVRFGDDFEPRSIWVDEKGNEKYLEYQAPRKWSLVVCDPENLLNNQNLYEDDQVKLTITLAREEAVEWKQIKQNILAACKELKLEVYGVKLEINNIKQKPQNKLERVATHEDTFTSFCNVEKVASQIRAVGKGIINDGTCLL